MFRRWTLSPATAAVLAAVTLILGETSVRLAAAPPPSVAEVEVSLRQKMRVYERQYAADPESPGNAWLLLDIVAAAEVLGNEPLAGRFKLMLIGQYPSTIPARYVLKTFGGDKEYRGFLEKSLDAHKPSLQVVQARLFANAVSLGHERWPADFLSGDQFLLQVALIGWTAGEDALVVAAKDRLMAATGDHRRIAELVFSTDTAAADKFVGLQRYHDHAVAVQLQLYFYDQTDSDQRRSRAVRQTAAEISLQQNACAEALPIIEGLISESATPQLMYWRALALCPLDRSQAIETLAQLRAQYPDDPWSGAATTIEPALRALDDSIASHAQAAHRTLRQLEKSGLRQLAATVQMGWRDAAGVFISQYTMRGMVDYARHVCGLEILVNDQVKLCFLTSQGSSRVYFDGESAIHTYASACMPQLAMSVNRTPDGKYHLNSSFNIANKDSGGSMDASGLLNSPLIGSVDALTELCRHTVDGGSFPLPPETTAEGARYRWIKPRLDVPEFSVVSFEVAPDNRLYQIESDTAILTDLAFGDAVANSAPVNFPSLPTNPTEPFGAVTLTRLFAVISGVIEDLSNQPRVARHAGGSGSISDPRHH